MVQGAAEEKADRGWRVMGDRATLEKIFAIMRRLLLVPMDGANPIPRKGTTRHECYRALYEIQELLEARRIFGKRLPQTNADRIRAMSDEELASEMCELTKPNCPPKHGWKLCVESKCKQCWLDWLRQEATDD